MNTVDDVPGWLRNMVVFHKGEWPHTSNAKHSVSRADFDTAARLISGEPDDSEAPEWARWKAQDSNGSWYWWSHPPHHDQTEWLYNSLVSPNRCDGASEGTVLGDWRDTLKPVNREANTMTPEQDAAVEQSKGPPKGATHECGGSYYHERGDGQYLWFNPRTEIWETSMAMNSSALLSAKLEPLSEPFMAPEERAYWYGGLTPEEDEEWQRKMAEQERQRNAVNHPDHYTQGGIECIDAIQASMSPDEFAGYLKGNMVKYVWRYKHKGGAQDLAKARWYLERLESHVSAL